MEETRQYVRAMRYYKRWMSRRYIGWMAYCWTIFGIIAGTAALTDQMAAYLNEPFDVVFFFECVEVAIPVALVIAFALRLAGVSASWVVVRTAKTVLESSGRERAAEFLVRRYRSVHPLVIADVDVQELLDAIFAPANPFERRGRVSTPGMEAKARRWSAVGYAFIAISLVALGWRLFEMIANR